MMGEELWKMCVHMCGGFIYIGHITTLGCLLLIHLACCYNAFNSFRECPDFISYSWWVQWFGLCLWQREILLPWSEPCGFSMG